MQVTYMYTNVSILRCCIEGWTFPHAPIVVWVVGSTGVPRSPIPWGRKWLNRGAGHMEGDAARGMKSKVTYIYLMLTLEVLH